MSRQEPQTPSKRVLRSNSGLGNTTPTCRSPLSGKNSSVQKTPIRKTRSSMGLNAAVALVDAAIANKENRNPDLAVLKTPVSERRHAGRKAFGDNAELLRSPSSFSEGASPLSIFRSAKNFFRPTSTPKKLVGRQKERSVIGDFLKDTAVAGKPGSIYISGCPGTGKTALVTEILNNLKTDYPKLSHKVFILNCMEISDPKQVFERILAGFGGPFPDEGDEDNYRALQDAVRNSKNSKVKAMRILVLDEIDHLISKDQSILYQLFELPVMEGSKLILIGIANALDLLDRYLPELRSRECLPEMLNFNPYNTAEISEIIKCRLKEVEATIDSDLPMDLEDSPKVALPLMHPSAIEFCARKASSSGDLRRALDVCRQSMEIMETEVEKMGSPLKEKASVASSPIKSIHDFPKVMISHIMKATTSAVVSGPVKIISGMSTQQKAVLLSLVLMWKKDPNCCMAVGNLHDAYLRVCKERKMLSPVSRSEFRDIISSLESFGLLVLHKAKEERDRRVELSVLESQVERGLQEIFIAFIIIKMVDSFVQIRLNRYELILQNPYLWLASLRAGVDIGRIAGIEGASAETHYYDPNEVFKIGQEVLNRHSSKIRSDLERFAIYEQVFIAALDTGNIDAAKGLLEKIKKRFPIKSSVRTLVLVGMLAEAEGDDAAATVAYQGVLKESEANAVAQKRLVTLQWAAGKKEEAIVALAKFADNYAQDVEAWSQLASYYLAQCMFQQAAYCLEEVMLLKPANHLVQIQYADLMTTSGKEDLALKYYCSALELCKDNVRALYGIRLVTASLIKKGSKTKDTKSKDKDAVTPDLEPCSPEYLEKLHKLAGDRLTAVYEARKGGKKDSADYSAVLKGWLQKV
ncbi:AAA ATPase [Phlyctochytrium planicorne]|nr:AAA ATPase [Phlyctochytrium planicorne]